MERSFAFMKSSPADRPLGVQIFGSEPAVLADAARILSDRGADLVDINMGCPVKNVIKRGAGASLLREPVKIARILRAVRNATSLPLTIKIRSGWDFNHINVLEVCRIAEDSGVDAVFLHARTASQGFRGRAEWRWIAEAKSETRIPIVGNGDVLKAADALRMIEETGCDGVMLGRVVLGNPWIFREILEPPAGHRNGTPDQEERRRVIQEHLALSVEIFGEAVGLRSFLRHLHWYTKGIPGVSHFRTEANSAKGEEDLRQLIDSFLPGTSVPPGQKAS
jgi:tRNA-dihydrouridine synthase B